MKLLWNCAAVGAGGALGAACRYLAGLLPVRPGSGFPVITLCVNVVGAFCIGLLVALACRSTSLSPRLILFLKVGVCGGFTTFSTFSLESWNLLQSGRFVAGLAYIVLSVLLCVTAVGAAQLLVS